ncbi:hypothetical protein [Vibrio sp. 10N.286.45.E10]|uniref:hypothetical protein n=1 Tax=Vibrio sp. 10N.286.45.E10 TaxID=1884476 RepID=UPI0039A59E48
MLKIRSIYHEICPLSHVLLEGKIHSSSQKGNNIVSSVSPLTDLESCQDISVDSTGYSVSFDDFVGVCVYKYDATNSAAPDQRASAYAISVAQKSVDNEVALFTPMPETTLVGETLVIDLKNDPNFVTEVPDSYTMDQDVTLIGEGEATADDTNQNYYSHTHRKTLALQKLFTLTVMAVI